ncbi:hypothetical protein ACLQ24_01785 [Micromonospora sp. DT4]|uniref:hypothetical protein n=1 Tax=Micromonospora sp. DT4 TaxID=3393438 RepID=UPI003CE85DCA
MRDPPGDHVEAELQSSVRQDAQGDVDHEGGDGSGQAAEARHSDEDVGNRSEDRAENERNCEQEDSEKAYKGLHDIINFLFLDELLPLRGHLAERVRPLTGALRGLANLLDHLVGAQAHGTVGLPLPHDPVHAGPHEAAIALQAASLLVPFLGESAQLLGVGVGRGNVGEGHDGIRSCRR